jgi:hypothetical protein
MPEEFIETNGFTQNYSSTRNKGVPLCIQHSCRFLLHLWYLESYGYNIQFKTSYICCNGQNALKLRAFHWKSGGLYREQTITFFTT